MILFAADSVTRHLAHTLSGQAIVT